MEIEAQIFLQHQFVKEPAPDHVEGPLNNRIKSLPFPAKDFINADKGYIEFIRISVYKSVSLKTFSCQFLEEKCCSKNSFCDSREIFC